MEHKEMLFAIAILLVAVVLVYFAIMPAKPVKNEAKELFFKSLETGMNSTNYVYEYEIGTGFTTKIKAVKSGGSAFVSRKTMLYENTIYFTSDDTTLCVDFKDTFSCVSVKNESELQEYISTEYGSLLPDKNKIELDISKMNFLYDKGALSFNSTITQKHVGGKECSGISYVIDYSKLSMNDAATVGLTSTAVAPIYGDVCLDAKTGQWYERTFKIGDAVFYSKLIKADWKNGEAITVPNVTDTETLAMISNEKDVEKTVLGCFAKNKEDADKCIHNNAIWEYMPQLCGLADSRADLCYFDMALAGNDANMCKLSSTLEEDCYLELGWQNRDLQFCDSIKNESKKAFCVEEIINAPPITDMTTQHKTTPPKELNQTEDDVISKIFEDVENK